MEQLRKYCQLLLSDVFDDHADAYRYLTRCEPFMRAVERLQSHDFGFFDVAALVARGGRNRRGIDAIRAIEAELVASQVVTLHCS